jgi:hypothetical protein
MIDIITPALQLALLGCLIIALMRFAAIFQQKREAKREREFRKATIARCAVSAIDFMHKEGWMPDPTVGPEVLHEGEHFVYIVMDRNPEPPKEASFHLEMEYLIRGMGENTRLVAMVYPALSGEHQLTVERVRDLSRYMHWTRATGGVVFTDLEPTFTASLHASDERIMLFHQHPVAAEP